MSSYFTVSILLLDLCLHCCQYVITVKIPRCKLTSPVTFAFTLLPHMLLPLSSSAVCVSLICDSIDLSLPLLTFFPPSFSIPLKISAPRQKFLLQLLTLSTATPILCEGTTFHSSDSRLLASLRGAERRERRRGSVSCRLLASK